MSYFLYCGLAKCYFLRVMQEESCKEGDLLPNFSLAVPGLGGG